MAFRNALTSSEKDETEKRRSVTPPPKGFPTGRPLLPTTWRNSSASERASEQASISLQCLSGIEQDVTNDVMKKLAAVSAFCIKPARSTPTAATAKIATPCRCRRRRRRRRREPHHELMIAIHVPMKNTTAHHCNQVHVFRQKTETRVKTSDDVDLKSCPDLRSNEERPKPAF